jgi:guanine deaminase
MDLMRDRGAAVAHCPLSNAYFGGAVFPLRRALGRGLRVGLGTDMSGGPAPSVWESARMALAAARMLESGTDPARPADGRGAGAARIDTRTAFHLATRGGAEAAGLPVGAFLPGLQFDAIAVDPAAAQGTIRLWPGDTGEAVLEKVLHGASRASIAAVWTDGVRRLGA